jgi:hypothetical protein
MVRPHSTWVGMNGHGRRGMALVQIMHCNAEIKGTVPGDSYTDLWKGKGDCRSNGAAWRLQHTLLGQAEQAGATSGNSRKLNLAVPLEQELMSCLLPRRV